MNVFQGKTQTAATIYKYIYIYIYIAKQILFLHDILKIIAIMKTIQLFE